MLSRLVITFLPRSKHFLISWLLHYPCTNVRIGPQRRLHAKALVLSNCGDGEVSWEPLDCKEIKPVNPKRYQPWIFIGRTDAEVESPILWPPDAKSWLIGTDLDAGKDWGQGEKGMTEDEMVGWHHWLNGPEFEQALGVGDGQGSLVCCSPWGCKELNITERNKYFTVYI